MAKRLNVEKTINGNSFKTKIGSVNRLNPASIYISGKTYISPMNEGEDYNELISLLDTDLKAILRRFTRANDFLNRNFISNLEVPKNGLKYGKNTFMFFQLFFSQNFSNPVCVDMETIREKMSPWINEALNEFENKIRERGFTIHEKRRA